MSYDENVNVFYNLFSQGKNIILHGPAGTGKTFLIKKFIQNLESDVNYKITAPTGVAALNIGGETIHRVFNISNYNILDNESEENLISRIVRRANPKIGNLQLLIIDEISMVGSILFRIIDGILRKKINMNKVFGGIQCIFLGDFYQLPPVKENFCFITNEWNLLDINKIDMFEFKRYENKETFDLVLRLRKSKLSEQDKEILLERNQAYKNKEFLQYEVEPIIIYSYNADVDSINGKKLLSLPTDRYKFKNYDKILYKDNRDYMNIKKLLSDSLPENLEFKEGANIIITKNIDIFSQLVNGKLAKITKINSPEFDIELTEINYLSYSVEIQFDDGTKHVIFPFRIEIEYNKLASIRIQFPFKLGWAITNHKAQGLSLDSAIVDVSNIFKEGQAYVTLSRVKDINKLFITKINFNKITTNRLVEENFN